MNGWSGKQLDSFQPLFRAVPAPVQYCLLARRASKGQDHSSNCSLLARRADKTSVNLIGNRSKTAFNNFPVYLSVRSQEGIPNHQQLLRCLPETFRHHVRVEPVHLAGEFADVWPHRQPDPRLGGVPRHRRAEPHVMSTARRAPARFAPRRPGRGH